MRTSDRARKLGFRLLVATTVGAGTLPYLAAQARPAPVPAAPDNKTIVHVLNRIGFGPRPGDVERVRSIGLHTYIEQQLTPERLEDAGMGPRLASLETLTKTSREIAEQYVLPGLRLRQQQRQQAASAPAATTDMAQPDAKMRSPEQMEAAKAERKMVADLSEQKVLRAAYSERQLDEVMVDFWFNHFNVFAGKGQVRVYLTEYERDAIRPHVFGKFRQLLQATAESPAMLVFLDNAQNVAPAAERTISGRPGAGPTAA